MLIEQVKRKLSKGYSLVQRFSYGLPYWRFEKGRKVSVYPRINEDAFCYLAYDARVIKSFKEIKDNVRFFKLSNS